MDPGSVILGGLGGALVASIAAYVGARRLQDAAIGRRERGAARAVYYEVARIASDLIVAHQNDLPMPPVLTTTYDQAAADLAVFLDPPDFDVVAFAFYSVHLYGWHVQTGATDLPGLPVLVGRFTDARKVLERTAFTPAELAARRARLSPT